MSKRLSLFSSFFLLLLALSFFSSGCKKYDQVELSDYNPEFAIPLLQTKLSVEDVLSRFDDDTFITIDEEGFVTMNYKGDVTARTSSEIFESIAKTEGLFPLLDTSTVLPFATPNGFDMDYALIDSGTVQFIYSADFDEPITIEVVVPNLLTPSGDTFRYFRQHTNGVLPLFYSQIYELKDHILRPTNDSIYVQYYVHLEDSGIREKLPGIGLNLLGFTASYVEGYMGQEIYEIPRDTIEIDFFENWTRGEVYFENPRIQVKVINSFGFPVRSKANIMNIFAANGEVLTLESNYLDSINIAYPPLDDVGNHRTTLFYFDKTNSNIDIVLGSNPVAVDYEMRALANPDQDTTIRGFMTDTSEFIIQVEVELPMHGQALGFVARDTAELDLGTYEEVSSAEFKIISENELPLEIALQAYFLEEDDTVLDSLFLESQPIIAAAPVDGEGQVIEKEELTTYVTVDAERFDKLRAAKKMLINTAFSTYSQGQVPVKIYNHQGVDVRMGMKIELQQ